MADWIKLEHVTPDKPEVTGTARRLTMTPEQVVGHLCRLWIWADQQSLDGNALRVTESDIDHFAHCPGLAAALREEGWLTGRDRALQLPNFRRHNGQTAKARALTQRRVRDFRAQSCNGSVTESAFHPSSLLFSALFLDLGRKDFLESGDFCAAWVEWLEYRKAKRKPVSDLGAKQSLVKLVPYGPAAAIATIRASIANDWQGLFPERAAAPGQAQTNKERGDAHYTGGF